MKRVLVLAKDHVEFRRWLDELPDAVRASYGFTYVHDKYQAMGLVDFFVVKLPGWNLVNDPWHSDISNAIRVRPGAEIVTAQQLLDAVATTLAKGIHDG